ncbi:hypothetical protein [Halobacillus sp. A5]|uniref:hypothetical protein n=1 Tax=Halobacillus sp. A5 TaxID=2880263 RepID=UPI0020A672CE|nr:hypothetical protein [Halobacillus sp. A5]MCP3025535.1 hypothetical protein [Halobacillus sp. A5]
MAGKNNKIIISYNKDREAPNDIVQAKKEQAAADAEKLQKAKSASPPKVYRLPSFHKRLSPFSLRYVSLSVMTAIVISFVLGFLLLKLFVSVTEESAPPIEETSAGAQTESVTAAMLSVELPHLATEVVQSGVFTSLETAEEWQGKLTEQSLPSVIWKQQDQYFLLSGSDDSEAGVEKAADDLAELDVPTYLKVWEVNSGELDVPESQLSNVENLIDHLEKNTLHTVSVEEREKILTEWKEAGGNQDLEKALTVWTDKTDHGISWLNLAQAFETMKK